MAAVIFYFNFSLLEIPNVQDPFGYDNDEDYKGGIPILEPVKCEPFDADGTYTCLCV